VTLIVLLVIILTISKRNSKSESNQNTTSYVYLHTKHCATKDKSDDEPLTWNDHVKTVISKANKVKEFLLHTIKHCPIAIKARCYNCMIKPTLEYISAIWSPYTQKNTVEAVQRQSAKFIFKNYSSYTSVSEIFLSKLDFKTLSDRRNESRLILLYKIINNLVDIDT